MVAGSFTRESTSTIPLERIWKAGILDAHNLIPKLLPNFISSVDLVEGDGGVGTIKRFNFTDVVKEFRFATDKTVVLDNEKYVVKQDVLEGGLIGLRLKSYSFLLQFEVGSNGETVGRTTVEYDTLDDTPLSAEEQEQLMIGLNLMIQAVEGYLQANPTAYV
ncbi:hypothetical protein HPP92_011574 [Vanilla planifolia]|uniref:Bet v I/Major latex protein domain-containing protein n=1 Tax=Vanilla planifolia TaxID=51239 RepID=A0A835V4J4_VANPL|nr:hypothetical protein HPP92_011864 [Vanilla planifolia]KAG0483490.1 hypothetical protein HPP92_011574 [Vanilla planifolia]